MRQMMAITLGLLVPACCSAKAGKNATAPNFEDFATTEEWKGPAPKVIIDNPNVRMFRTQFREAASQPPNFAGHYRIKIWGCGTQCLEAGMLDLATGRVIELPATEQRKSWEHWMVCYSAFQPSGIESRANSRLLIVRCADVIGKDGGSYLRSSYFVYENHSFKKVFEEIGKDRVF